MENLEMTQKIAVLTSIYQLIASADGSVEPDRDNPTLDFVSNRLGFKHSSAFNLAWNGAIMSKPYEAFDKVSQLTFSQKQQFKQLILAISNFGGNKIGRYNCAQQIFQLTKC